MEDHNFMWLLLNIMSDTPVECFCALCGCLLRAQLLSVLLLKGDVCLVRHI